MRTGALAIGLLVAPLSALATPQAFQEQMNGWRGKTGQDLVAHFRNPVVAYDGDDYQMVAVQATGEPPFQRTTLTFGTTYRTAQGVPRIYESCRVAFTIRTLFRAQGALIESWYAEGDRCLPERLSPLPQASAPTTSPQPAAPDATAFQNEMDGWIGRPELEMIAHYKDRGIGYEGEHYWLVGFANDPLVEASTASGTAPGHERARKSTEIFGSMDTTPAGRVATDESCRVMFIIRGGLNSGVIEAWRAEGKRCVPEKLGPWPQVPAQTSPDATTFQNQMNRWIGRTRGEVGWHFVSSDVAYDGDDYRLHACAPLDAWQTFYFGSANSPPKILSVFSGQSLYNESCTVTFMLRDGVIETWRAEGSRCVAERPGTGQSPRPGADRPELPLAVLAFGRSFEWPKTIAELLCLVGIPFAVTIACFVRVRSRSVAITCAIVISELILLGLTLAFLPAFWGLFAFSQIIFLLVIACCLLAAMVMHVQTAFRPRDWVILGACGFAYLATTIAVFEASAQWHNRISVEATSTCQSVLAPPPAVLAKIDTGKQWLSMPIPWLVSGRDQYDLYPLVPFLSLATINGFLIGYGCAVIIRALRKLRAARN